MIIGTAMIAPYLRCIPGSPRAVGSYDGQTRRPGATPTSLDAGPFSLPDRTIIAPSPPEMSQRLDNLACAHVGCIQRNHEISTAAWVSKHDPRPVVERLGGDAVTSSQAPYRLARLHAGARTSLAGRSGSDSSAHPAPISS